MRDEIDPARIAKLPMWAQEHIKDLGRTISNQRSALAWFKDQKEPTRVSYGDTYNFHGDDSPGRFYVPNNEPVSFHMMPGVDDTDYIITVQHSSHDPYTLVVRSPGGFRRRLTVRPSSSNELTVSLDKRDD